MRFRLTVFLVIIICFCFVVCGCQTGGEVIDPSDEEAAVEQEISITQTSYANIRIGVSLQGLQRPYIVRVKEQLERIVEGMGDEVELIILDGQENSEKQNAQVEYFISKKVDVIIFNAISYEDGYLGVELANEAGIPVVLLITTVANVEKTQAQAISDHSESALIQIDMVAEYLSGRGNIVILEGLKGIESQIDRTDGYEQRLAMYPGIHVVEIQTANWTRADAYAIVENWIRLNKDFSVVVAQNDNMALGAVQAVEEAGMQDEIAVFGIDGDMDAMLLVKEGRLKGTVYHDAAGQAERAIMYAISLAKGLDVLSEPVPFFSVDIDNVDYYIDLEEYNR